MPVHVPLITLGPTGEDPPAQRPQVAFVTSPSPARLEPRLVSVLGGVPLVALGEKTAQSLLALGLEVVATGPGGGEETVDLVEQVAGELDLPGSAVIWHVGAREVSAALEMALARWHRPVLRWQVYDNQVPEGALQRLQAALPVQVLTFASGSAVTAYARLAAQGEARLAVIGQPTAKAARQAGLRVDRIAAEPTMAALAGAAAALCDLSRPGAR